MANIIKQIRKKVGYDEASQQDLYTFYSVGSNTHLIDTFVPNIDLEEYLQLGSPSYTSFSKDSLNSIINEYYFKQISASPNVERNYYQINNSNQTFTYPFYKKVTTIIQNSDDFIKVGEDESGDQLLIIEQGSDDFIVNRVALNKNEQTQEDSYTKRIIIQLFYYKETINTETSAWEEVIIPLLEKEIYMSSNFNIIETLNQINNQSILYNTVDDTITLVSPVEESQELEENSEETTVSEQPEDDNDLTTVTEQPLSEGGGE